MNGKFPLELPVAGVVVVGVVELVVGVVLEEVVVAGGALAVAGAGVVDVVRGSTYC